MLGDWTQRVSSIASTILEEAQDVLDEAAQEADAEFQEQEWGTDSESLDQDADDLIHEHDDVGPQWGDGLEESPVQTPSITSPVSKVTPQQHKSTYIMPEGNSERTEPFETAESPTQSTKSISNLITSSLPSPDTIKSSKLLLSGLASKLSEKVAPISLQESEPLSNEMMNTSSSYLSPNDSQSKPAHDDNIGSNVSNPNLERLKQNSNMDDHDDVSSHIEEQQINLEDPAHGSGDCEQYQSATSVDAGVENVDPDGNMVNSDQSVEVERTMDNASTDNIISPVDGSIRDQDVALETQLRDSRRALLRAEGDYDELLAQNKRLENRIRELEQSHHLRLNDTTAQDERVVELSKALAHERKARIEFEKESDEREEALRRKLELSTGSQQEVYKLSSELAATKADLQLANKDNEHQRGDIETLRSALARSSSESSQKIKVLQGALSRMQHELEEANRIQFQAGKDSVIDQLNEANVECELLRSKLQDVQRVTSTQQTRIQELELTVSNLKTSVAESIDKLNHPDENDSNSVSVDRRIVNKLLVTFIERGIHSKFTTKQVEVLELMAEMLNFTRAERVRVGLLKPTTKADHAMLATRSNTSSGNLKSKTTQLLSTVLWGTDSVKNTESSANLGKHNIADTSNRSFGDLWAEFIERETSAPIQPETNKPLRTPTTISSATSVHDNNEAVTTTQNTDNDAKDMAHAAVTNDLLPPPTHADPQPVTLVEGVDSSSTRDSNKVMGVENDTGNTVQTTNTKSDPTVQAAYIDAGLTAANVDAGLTTTNDNT